MDDSSVFGRKAPGPAAIPAWAIVDRFPCVGPMADDSHEPFELRRDLAVALRASLRRTRFRYEIAGGEA